MQIRLIAYAPGLGGLALLWAATTASRAAGAPFDELAPVPLYAEAPPGSEDAKCPERVGGKWPDRIVYNVSVPAYQPFLPKARATGTAVIIAPGGGFQYLATDNEGNELAKWLAARGIATFVLKYRVSQTDPNNPPRVGLAPVPPRAAPDPCMAARAEAATPSIEARGQPGIADGIAAIKAVRERAVTYHIDPQRVVMLGFSAGAMVTTGTVLQEEAAARPNFAAPIYGGPFGALPVIPQGLPPLFLALAQNDKLVAAPVKAFYDALYAAGYRPELHLYNGGNHGFGMHTLGTTSDHWKEAFLWWLESFGLTHRPGDPPRPVTPEFARPSGP